MKFILSIIISFRVMMLKDYERPLYIHVGNVRTAINMTKFEDSCFEPVIENKIWKVEC